MTAIPSTEPQPIFARTRLRGDHDAATGTVHSAGAGISTETLKVLVLSLLLLAVVTGWF